MLVLLGMIAALLIVMAGVFILDWFLARWLPLAAWTGICMIAFVATVLRKSARALRKEKSR